MDLFTYLPSLTLTLRVSLPELKRELPKHKTSLCSTGVFRLDTQGQGCLNTITEYYTKPSIWHCSLGNTSSVLQGKSLTARILAGNSPQLLALLYRWPQKLRCKSHNHHAAIYPSGDVMWCGGRLVGWLGVKALDSSVERLWFNLQSTSRQLLLSLQSNIPQCPLV